MLDRLAQPHNIRRLLAAFVALTVLAVGLAALAVVREFKTAGKVERVTERVTRVERPAPPTVQQTRRALDRAITSLTIPQRRRLLDRLLNAATLKQLKRIRTRAKVVTRKRARQMERRRAAPRGSSVTRSPARGRSATPRAIPPPPLVLAPPAPPPPPPAALPTPPLVPALPAPAQGKAKGKDKQKGRDKGQADTQNLRSTQDAPSLNPAGKPKPGRGHGRK